jgi:site-specific DNA recombinase
METGIYVRVSTEEQAREGFSIRAQQQKLKDYARIKEWSIYKIYVDEGISGKNITERPAINEMLEDVKTGQVKNVLVFKIDRLTRSTKDLEPIRKIRKYGKLSLVMKQWKRKRATNHGPYQKDFGKR